MGDFLVKEWKENLMKITDLEINPAEVNPGEQILVTANILNTSDSEANYSLELKVNGITKFTTEVALPAGETVELRVSGGEQVIQQFPQLVKLLLW